MPWYCPVIEASKEEIRSEKSLDCMSETARGCVVTRVCFLLKVRAERLAEYRERHKAVWPEMLDALQATGWHNYSLFLRPDGLLIGYLETPDFERARAAMQSHPVNARWQAEMAPFFESLENENADASMMPLEEVFHLD
jgi:L-rhamnose mutarotase